MSVLRVTTFRGLGVGDWSFYPGSAQKLVSKPMGLVIAELVGDPPQSVVSQKQPDSPFVGAHESHRRVGAQVVRMQREFVEATKQLSRLADRIAKIQGADA